MYILQISTLRTTKVAAGLTRRQQGTNKEVQTCKRENTGKEQYKVKKGFKMQPGNVYIVQLRLENEGIVLGATSSGRIQSRNSRSEQHACKIYIHASVQVQENMYRVQPAGLHKSTSAQKKTNQVSEHKYRQQPRKSGNT